MPWVAVAGLAISAAGSYASSRNAKKAERRGRTADQAQLEQIRRMEERYNKYYAPLEKQMSSELQEGPDLRGEADRARGEFGQSFDASMDAARRQQRRYGLDPTSMQAQRFEEDQGYERAAGMATAANQARTEEDDRHFARQLSFMGGGGGLPAQVAQHYGNTADRQYGRANTYGQDAAYGINAAAQFGTMAYRGYQNRDSTPDTSKTTSLQTPTKFSSSGTGGLNKNQMNAHKQYGLSRLQGYD